MPTQVIVRLFYNNRFVFGFVDEATSGYSQVYKFACAPREDLAEWVFEKFNTAHPWDFDERSFSVGDIVTVEHEDGRRIAAWRCSARDWENVSSTFQW